MADELTPLERLRANIEATKERSRALYAEFVRIDEPAKAEGRDMTPAEDARSQDLADQLAQLQDELRQMEARELQLAQMVTNATSARRVPSLEGGRSPELTLWRRRDPWADERGTGRDPLLRNQTLTDDLVARALTAVERTKFADDGRRTVVSRHLERDAGLPGQLGWLAQWSIAASDPDYLSAFHKTVVDPVRGFAMWTDAERQAAARMDQLTRAMSVGTDANGGYLSLPLALDPAIRLSNNGELNPLAVVATTELLAGTDTYRLPYTAGVTASWDGEAGTVSDDTPTFAVEDITAYKWQAFIPYSIEVEGDTANFSEKMAMLLVEGADRLEAQSFMTGSGSNQPSGLITNLDANTNVEVVVTTDGAFGVVDVFKVHKALPARWRTESAKCSWFGHIGTIDYLRQQVMAQNSANSVWADMANGEPPRLLGHPVYEVTTGLADFDGTTGAANLMVIGGMRDAYTIVRRVGTQVELIPHLFDVTNNRPTGQRGFYAWGRTGGSAVVENAARLLQNT
ncbi:MAG: phage major capsid protein [Acidimicrobiia bacterium]